MATYLPVVSVYNGERLDLFNATEKDSLLVENPQKHEVVATIYDCFGEKVSTETLCGELLRLEVPSAGRVNLTVK